MKRLWIGFLLIAVILAGCQTAKPGDLTSATPVPGGDASSTAQVETVIIYERSGGLQGKTETWMIYPDGRVLSKTGDELTASKEDVQSLIKLMEDKGFFEMGDYGKKNTCNDCYHYTITYKQGDKAHVVTTVDAAPDQPADLQPILDAIAKLTSK